MYFCPQRTGKLSKAPVRPGLKGWRLDTHQEKGQLIEATFCVLSSIWLICLGSDKQH